MVESSLLPDVCGEFEEMQLLFAASASAVLAFAVIELYIQRPISSSKSESSSSEVLLSDLFCIAMAEDEATATAYLLK